MHFSGAAAFRGPFHFSSLDASLRVLAEERGNELGSHDPLTDGLDRHGGILSETIRSGARVSRGSAGAPDRSE